MDLNPLAAGMLVADTRISPPHCRSSDFIDFVLDSCERLGTRLLIPLIDTELSTFAGHRETFSSRGVLVNVSGAEAVQLCLDKLRFAEHLAEANLPGVPTLAAEEARTALRRGRQLVAKPRFGSSSNGVVLLEPADKGRELFLDTENDLIQPHIDGVEYAADIFVKDIVRSICLRKQVEMRGGETSIATTVYDERLQAIVRDVVESLPDCFGVVSADLIVERNTNRVYVLEVNPRFAGGFPLSWRAGSPMVGWLIDLAMGVEVDFSNQAEFRQMSASRYLMSLYSEDESSHTPKDGS